MERKYIYLHTNGELIEKSPLAVETGGNAQTYFYSPFVVKYWVISNQDDLDAVKMEAEGIMEELKNKQDLLAKVDRIISLSGDPEVAHSEEDELHLEVINKFCPDWVKKEINRLNMADFPRWCA